MTPNVEREGLPELPEDAAAAHMYPSDLEKFKTGEHFASAFSIKVGCPDDVSVPLFTAEQVWAHVDACMPKWLPIESAPKDGTEIDVWFGDDHSPHREADAFWGNPKLGNRAPCLCRKVFDECFGWINEAIGQPTHWMPLPKAPILPLQGEPHA